MSIREICAYTESYASTQAFEQIKIVDCPECHISDVCKSMMMIRRAVNAH